MLTSGFCLLHDSARAHHCKSNATVAEFQLESYGPSHTQPRPPSKQFPFVFTFKEASGQPEVSQSGKK
jgi:hypothetical protein